MPLQNRVTPFGEIVATPQRGMFTGNRGIIHDPATRTLLKRRWANKAWLVWVCEFNGRRRAVMERRSWTELSFLDEAVALAAGHRPCFFCRRLDAEAFRAAWARSRAAKLPLASEIDAVLHAERLDRGLKRLHALPGGTDELPDGAVVAAAGEAYTLAHGHAFRWTPRGYESAAGIPRADALITPECSCELANLSPEASPLRATAPDDRGGRDFALMPTPGPSYWRRSLGRFRLSGAGGGPLRNAHKENSRCSATS